MATHVRSTRCGANAIKAQQATIQLSLETFQNGKGMRAQSAPITTHKKPHTAIIISISNDLKWVRFEKNCKNKFVCFIWGYGPFQNGKGMRAQSVSITIHGYHHMTQYRHTWIYAVNVGTQKKTQL